MILKLCLKMKRVEQPDRMVNIVEENLEFNRKNQEGVKIKILTKNVNTRSNAL